MSEDQGKKKKIVNIFALQLESPGAIRMQGKSRAHRMME
jgi:hypothetical protein